MKACFKGGPLNNQFIEIPDGHLTWEVARAPEMTRVSLGSATLEPVTIIRGRYELVPREQDHMWRIARLYTWKGWDDERFVDPRSESPGDRRSRVSPRPWVAVWERSDPEGWFCPGIRDANEDWVVRFDDDYGTDQAANAELIIDAVHFHDARAVASDAVASGSG